jgi:hypothetical protein
MKQKEVRKDADRGMQPLASCRRRIDGVLAAGVDSSCLVEGGGPGGFTQAGRTSEIPLFSVLRARGVDDGMSFTFSPPFLSDLLVTHQGLIVD